MTSSERAPDIHQTRLVQPIDPSWAPSVGIHAYLALEWRSGMAPVARHEYLAPEPRWSAAE
jgi:hypothetical protein